MAKVFTIPVPPEVVRKRARERTADPRYVDGQRLLVEAMRYLSIVSPFSKGEISRKQAYSLRNHEGTIHPSRFRRIAPERNSSNSSVPTCDMGIFPKWWRLRLSSGDRRQEK